MSILGDNVHVRRDDDGTVRLLRHNQAPFRADPSLPVASPRNLARTYLDQVRDDFGVAPDWLTTVDEAVPAGPRAETNRLRIDEEKSIGGLRIVGYRQTYLGLPVWRAGLNVRIQKDPLRVLSSQSTVHLEVDLRLPGDTPGDSDLADAGALLDRSAEGTEELVRRIVEMSEERSSDRLRRLVKRNQAEGMEITGTSTWIYRYEPDKRFDPEAGREGQGPPTLEAPEVPNAIQPDCHYLVTEVRFTLALPDWGRLNWRVFFEATTGAVLYVRAFVQHVSGMVFSADPIRQTGDASLEPCSAASDLDPLRSDVELEGLDIADPQTLSGEYVEISDENAPNISGPSESSGDDFDYSADTDDFAAVNAYYHLDSLYRMVIEDFAFSDYFSSFSFPIPVDHRGQGGGANAAHYGDDSGCATSKFTFGLLESGCDVGYATLRAPVIHEFGHSCLQAHICDGTFSWAHGVGDALAVIMMDPGSEAEDRFVRSPFFADTSNAASRRHDREPADGWSWGGTEDDGSYQSTQILSTSLFRAYRSTGGDDNHGNPDVQLARREFASRYMSYLIVGAVGSLTSTSPPSDADDFATALIDFEQATDDFEGHPGGAFHKVVRWAFEKQGLYGGDPPDVDVYIDGGRGGEYEWQQRFWNSNDIWNRRSDDGGTAHETPVVDESNYLYVRVGNRGTETAENVSVDAYQCRPAAGLVWSDDWQATTTATLPAGDIPSGGETVVGPFEWIPEEEGHACVLASVSADGDASNADTVDGSIPHWRLVPFDNNIAQRNLAPVPGGDSDALDIAMSRRPIWVHNPEDRTVTVQIDALLPRVLRTNGWKLRVLSRGGERFQLGPRAERKVVVELDPGGAFSPGEVPAAGADINVDVSVDRRLVGGMTYRLDRDMTRVPTEHPSDGPSAAEECSTSAEELLRCLDLPSEGVCSARLRKVTVDITFERDEC